VAPAPAGAEGVRLLNGVEQAQRHSRRMVRQILTIHASLILFIAITKAAAVQVA
jgi:hypothetical protein